MQFDSHQTIVTAALMAKSRAETPKRLLGRSLGSHECFPQSLHCIFSSWGESRFRSRKRDLEAKLLLLIQIVFFQEFGPESLWRSWNVWPTLWRKVHEIPIWPNRVDMIPRQFSSPEMKNLSFLPPKYMHHWQLHIIRVSLAFVIGYGQALDSTVR